VTKEWSTYKPADLLETYEAQIFISLAINDRESPQVRLITHQFDDVVPLPTQKNIIQFWDDNTPPEDVQDCIQSWRDLNPSYNHILYSDEAARAFIDKEFGARFARCYDMCHHPAMKSDLLRMLALYYHGGIYFDADLVCIRSLERTLVRDLIGTPGLITIPVVPSFPYAINNDIVSAAKGSPFMIRIAERAATRIEEDYNAGIVSDVGQVTGPGLYTRSIASEILAGSQRGALTEGAERYIIIPFSYRNIMLRSRGDLQYFRTRSHWSVAQQNRK
jgi:hypothetical protein